MASADLPSADGLAEKGSADGGNGGVGLETKVRPTKKQRELLLFIESFIEEHGYSPSYREIMNGCHYNSVATVALHVGNLIKRGHIRKRDRSARSLEVTDPQLRPAAAPKTASDEQGQRWLLEQAESLFRRAEGVQAAGKPVMAEVVDQLQSLVMVLHVLDMASQAEAFAQRIANLQD